MTTKKPSEPNRCFECRWFDQTHPADGTRDERAEGLCRMSPPLIIYQRDIARGAWPMVRGRDWCSDFEEDIA